jgi:SAM-dependent methyltransferase
MVDITRHMRGTLAFMALRRMRAHLLKISAAAKLPLSEVETAHASLQQAKTLDELLERAPIRYLAPADARTTALPSGSVDLVYSNSVLEHIPPDVLQDIMHESKRILRLGGHIAHSVAYCDHYAFFDKSISFVNYLKYSDKAWRLWAALDPAPQLSEPTQSGRIHPDGRCFRRKAQPR